MVPMRPVVGLGLFVGLASACLGDGRETAVVPASIEVSDDRRTLTVVTFYPIKFNCGKLPGGLDVDIKDDVAVITAVMRSDSGGGNCTMECASVTQSITLPDPLPTGVRFEAPPNADPGCGSGIYVPTASTANSVAG